ncbi:hypothetical protein DPMN_184260 [Dreissena polymorpha]|uniref:Uncharacterized protein n=1 Tax=Dreissena polymorpha TaxID=45954 RepID=A0A9D4DK10_DREPO|nr:hypothetical protein DPMN_184260 [Dreissena polymorpha]
MIPWYSVIFGICVSFSQCSKVTPISELNDPHPTDLQGLSAEQETVLVEIMSLQSSQEASIQSLQGS